MAIPVGDSNLLTAVGRKSTIRSYRGAASVIKDFDGERERERDEERARETERQAEPLVKKSKVEERLVLAR